MLPFSPINRLTALDGRPVIVGSGLAGLTVALALAPMPCVLLSAKEVGQYSSSLWAQGGIAASVGADDNAALHAEDTMAAGAGLCDADIVRQVTMEGPTVVDTLLAHGVAFDRNEAGALKLGLEAAHCRRRIVHSGGDTTGRVVTETLAKAALATPSVTIIENALAADILTENGSVSGIVFAKDGKRHAIATGRVVLATGGAGALWQQTTNPLGSWGHGLALAARAGARLSDLEFMQFHPTAIDVGQDPMPLASEALRGEGAILVNDEGERFMSGYDRRELEPRDIVARAIWQQIVAGRRVFLDARDAIGPAFAARFPTIHAYCMAAGLDPAKSPIPIRPAAHYHMGGIAVDHRGRSSLKGLWAAGETGATGLHGANRLASNSLLEAAAYGNHVALDILGTTAQAPGYLGAVSMPRRHEDQTLRALIRQTMSAHAGVLRDSDGLTKARKILAPFTAQSDMALVAFMIASMALSRTESRGGHARTDYPQTNPLLASRRTLALNDVTEDIAALADDPSAETRKRRFATGAIA